MAYKDMHFHCLQPGRVKEMQGFDSCASKTMGKLIMAVTHQAILMK